jgi:hypothetical protein
MTSDFDDTTPPTDAPPPRPGLLDTYRSWPQWARIMAPVAAVILGLALVSGITGGAGESDTETLAAAGSATTEREAPREPSTTQTPPTTAPPTTAAPTTVPPTLPPTTTPPPPTTVGPPTTAAPAPPPAPPAPTPAPAPVAPSPSPAVSYQNCDAARAAGVTPLHRGDPGYAAHLDRDNDGIACE